MGDRRLKILLLVPPLAALLLGGAAGLLMRPTLLGRSEPAPAPMPAAMADPHPILRGALSSLQAHGRLVTATGDHIAVATSTERRLGLSARKTLIVPGRVRYGVDLARLRPSDLHWDPATLTLDVRLPPLEISGPDVDLAGVQEYSEGGLLMALTDAERELDQANIRSAQDQLMRQARERTPMHLARQSAMRLVASSFALPLRAAGVDARVATRFVDPAGDEVAAFVDASRPAVRAASSMPEKSRAPADGVLR